MNHDIEQAVEKFRQRAGRYAKNERYYRGDHDLAFATEKFENAFGSLFRAFALNLCPAVCDAVKDKLRVTGFGVQSAGFSPSHLRDESSALNEEARRIWDANRMGTRAGEVHKEALKNGDAYLIVWPDTDGTAVMYTNRAETCEVFYDDEQPGKILWAAKYWRGADKRIRLNLFYTDRIERYTSQKASETLYCDPVDLIPFLDPSIQNPQSAIQNPYGVVPVFHFANNSDIGRPGVSELDPVIPIQDGLNKSVLDMLVAMEYSAYRQRWVAGIEVDKDEETGEIIPPYKSGVDHLWVSPSNETRFGDFNSADLEQFLKVKDGFRLDIASVTGTPLHYLQPQTLAMPSGESQRRAESRFIAKVRDRQGSFGQVWSDAMEFALRIEGVADARLTTQWEDPAAFSEQERLENLLLEKKIGVDVGSEK